MRPVDRPARDTAATLLRDFISGRISNTAFEAGLPTTDDDAIWVLETWMWYFYDDVRTHHLTGQHQLTPAEYSQALRFILFLDGNRRYEWPEHDLAFAYKNFDRSWPFTARAKRARSFFNAGDVQVWPFLRRRDYKDALHHPKRLVGARQ